MLITEWIFALPDYMESCKSNNNRSLRTRNCGSVKAADVTTVFRANITTEDRHLKKLKVEEKLRAEERKGRGKSHQT